MVLPVKNIEIESDNGKIEKKNRKATLFFKFLVLFGILILFQPIISLRLQYIYNEHITCDCFPYKMLRIELRGLEISVKMYEVEHGALPISLEQLLDPDIPGGPYLEKKELPIDSWGNPYIYNQFEDGTFEILSYSCDKVPGGEGNAADISTKNLRSCTKFTHLHLKDLIHIPLGRSIQ